MSSDQERSRSLREHAEKMDRWGENPQRPPDADDVSDRLAAQAGLPSEADRRDRWAGVQDEADEADSSAGEESASGGR